VRSPGADIAEKLGEDTRAEAMKLLNVAFEGDIAKKAGRWASAGHVNCRQTQSRRRHRR